MGLYGFISQLAFSVSFLLMALLIDELVDTNSSDSREKGLIYGACYSLAIIVMLVFMHQSDFKGTTAFIKMRKALTGLLYSKILTLSLHSIS